MIEAAALLHAWNWVAAEIKVCSILLCLGLFYGRLLTGRMSLRDFHKTYRWSSHRDPASPDKSLPR